MAKGKIHKVILETLIQTIRESAKFHNLIKTNLPSMTTTKNQNILAVTPTIMEKKLKKIKMVMS